MTARYPLVLSGNTIQELQTTDTLAGQAASGINSDITSLTGLTTALSVSQGGTGANTLTGLIKGSGNSAFTAAVAGTDYIVPGGALGAPLSGNLANCTNVSLSTGVTGTLSVSLGGTGANSLTGILKANGNSAFTAVTAPTGALVGTTDAQTLTNKTITLIGSYETKTAMANAAIDLSLGTYFTKTISTATTFTISNTPSANTVGNFILELTNAGSQTITWWSGLKWTGGTAPTLTTSGVDILAFYAHDGGTTWRGLVLSKDSK